MSRVVRAVWGFVLGLVWPGVGLIYARRWAAGAITAAITLALLTALNIFTEFRGPTPGNVWAVVIALGLLAPFYLAATLYGAWLLLRAPRVRPAVAWYRSAWLAFLVVEALPFAAIRVFPLRWQTYNLPSASNIPTLLVGDRVLADMRPSYRPRRGDIIIFRGPRGEAWVKRVVGLPGEKLRIAGGVVSIDNHPAERRNPRPYAIPDMAAHAEATEWDEFLPGSGRHSIIAMSDSGEFENTQEVDVPPAHFLRSGRQSGQ